MVRASAPTDSTLSSDLKQFFFGTVIWVVLATGLAKLADLLPTCSANVALHFGQTSGQNEPIYCPDFFAVCFNQTTGLL